MFKHYYVTDLFGRTDEFYVGATADIKALYKSIRRNKSTLLCPWHIDMPKFSDKKNIYALCIDEENYIHIVNSDTMLSILINNELYIREVV